MSRLDQVELLFHEALSLPGGDRAGWIKAQCGPDSDLLDDVLSLLDAHAQMSTGGIAAATEFPVPSAQFGAWRAVELQGRGGTSSVYRARRADGQFDQTVALKIMASYLAGPDFLRRFEMERQLLASLNHHNITRLLDGGVSASGDAYLITEYVEGQTIDRYCDDRNLDVSARLGIFLQVCDAVDYAHRNLIVHRDLKPANILVDTEGTVKLLDFGTASLQAAGDVTVTRMRMLTPRYASPEQLRGERLSVATDVFSLGVVLYELLSGTWPFGNPDSALSGLSRAVGDVPAKPPSTAITEQAAQCRSLSRDHLERALKGDLATIVLKMLEPEPARRYGSVRQVADDLERYRQGRPILARPQTTWYRARKFASRHWLGVAAVSVAALALAGLTAFSLYQSAQARRQAARAERISRFVKDTFLSASSTWQSPLRGQSRAIQIQDVLDSAAERVGRELADDPLAEADLRGTLGSTYSVLGDPVKGEAQILLALGRLAQTPGGSPRIATEMLVRLCDARSYQGHYEGALAACRDALALARVHGSSVWLGGIMHDTAFMALKSGVPFEEAEKLFREAMSSGPADPSSARLWPAILNTRIGALCLKRGDLEQGERLLAEADRVLRAEPGPPIEIVPVLVARAFGARIRGDYEQAQRFLRESLDMLAQRPTSYMGRDQIEIEMAAAEALAGKQSALPRLRKAEAALQGPSSSAPERVHFEMLSGIVEARCGLPDSGEKRLRSALAISEKEVPGQPGDRVEVYLRLAQLLAGSGRPREAAEAARQGRQVAQAAYGKFFAAHPFVTELQKMAALQ